MTTVRSAVVVREIRALELEAQPEADGWRVSCPVVDGWSTWARGALDVATRKAAARLFDHLAESSRAGRPALSVSTRVVLDTCSTADDYAEVP